MRKEESFWKEKKKKRKKKKKNGPSPLANYKTFLTGFS